MLDKLQYSAESFQRGWQFTDSEQDDILMWDSFQFLNCPSKDKKISFPEMPTAFDSWQPDIHKQHPIHQLTSSDWGRKTAVELRLHLDAPEFVRKEILDNLSLCFERRIACPQGRAMSHANSEWEFNKWHNLKASDFCNPAFRPNLLGADIFQDTCYSLPLSNIPLPRDFQLSICLDSRADLAKGSLFFPVFAKIYLFAQSLKS